MSKQLQKAQTKAEIKAAFWAAYETTPLNKITVQQLSATVGISRVTFYAYYADVPAILAETEQEILDAVEAQAKISKVSICDENIALNSLLDVVTLLEKYEAYVSLILGDHGDPTFELRLREIMKRLFMTNHSPLTPEKEYVLEFIFLSQFGLISYWLRQGKNITPQALAQLSRHLAIHGAADYLEQNA